MAKLAEAHHSVEVKRTIKAPRDRVFKAWTQPDQLKLWTAPGDMTAPAVDVNLRVGGRYRIEMQAPDGSRKTAFGEYIEVTPPSRLVYSWDWEGMPSVNSIVTVEFAENGNNTEVTLRHDGLPTEDLKKRHAEGWHGCLEKLVTLF